jgi:ParB family chromosome partitioning protein
MNKRIITIPLAQIDVGPRLRSVDPAWVELLAASLGERGQDTPITVRPAEEAGRYILVAGGHRVAAAEVAGLETLDAFVTEATDDEATLAEIDENLMRRELSPLDRAVFLAARKDVYERLNPTAAHGKAKKNKGKEKTTSLSSFPLAFAQATATRLGLDPRSIQRAIARAAIPADVRAMIAGTPVAQSGAELDKLARLPLATQRKVAACLARAENPARTVAAAVNMVVGPLPAAPSIDQAREFQRLIEAWRKAGRKARQQFLRYLEAEAEVTLPPQKEPVA